MYKSVKAEQDLRKNLFKAEQGLAIAAQIRALRCLRGLSQEEMAIKLGTNQPTVSRMERTAYGLDKDALDKISEILDVGVVVYLEPYELTTAKAKAKALVKQQRVFPVDEFHYAP